MILNKRTKLILTLALIMLLGALIIVLSTKKEISQSSVLSSPDLIDHPIYSLYEFNESESVINIGIQPSYLPTGIIFEVIKRDNILKQTLAASGKKIEYYLFLKGADVNFFLEQKVLDGGVGGDMPALSLASSFDVFIPVIIQKGKAAIVSSRPMLTTDLKGKRIAYPYGSVSHYFILDLLHSTGIPENKVRLIPMDVSTMAKALHNDEIDLFSTWEPNVTAAIKQYPDFFIPYQQMTTGYLYFSEAFVHKNPEIVNHILAAVIRAISWMKNNRENLLLASEWNKEEIEKLTGEKNILNPEEIADLALEDILGYHSKYSIVISNEHVQINNSLYKEYAFLKALYSDKETRSWEQVVKSFDSTLINEILKHPKEFQLANYDYIIRN